MKFEVCILGSGSAVPTRTRTPTAQIINIQENYLLADCAEGTQLQLRNQGIKLQRIDAVFITHLHGDHFYGLPGLISTLHLLGRTKPLLIVGPPGLEKIVMPMVDITGSNLRYQLSFKSTQNKEKECVYENKRIQVFSFPLLHKIATTGYLFAEKQKPRQYLPEVGAFYGIPKFWIDRIKAGEDYIDDEGLRVDNSKLTKDPLKAKSYAFCTDTAYYPEMVDNIMGVNLIYHESSFLEEDRKRADQTKHSTASDAAKIAKMAKANKLVLGHFSARYKDVSRFEEEAKEIFKNVQLAKDGLILKV